MEYVRGKTAVAVALSSLRLPAGTLTGLVGESGSGKSSIALALFGLVRPGGSITGGEVVIDGQEILAMSRHRRREWLAARMAFVPQETFLSLAPDIRIASQTRAVLGFRAGTPQPRGRLEREMDLLGIESPSLVCAQRPEQLSGGLRQRVLLALAFATRPPLLVLDEPATALDLHATARLTDRLRSWREGGGAALVVAHDTRWIGTLADRVMVMFGGVVVEGGPTEDLLAKPLHPYTRLLVATASGETPPDPSSGAVPVAGCRFAARCQHAQEACRNDDPPPEEADPFRTVACWRWRELSERG